MENGMVKLLCKTQTSNTNTTEGHLTHVDLKHLQALKYHKELDRFFPLIQARLNEKQTYIRDDTRVLIKFKIPNIYIYIYI